MTQTLIPPARPRLRSLRRRPPAAVGGRFMLYDIDWPTYRRLREAPEHDGYRFTYDGPTGRLEVEVSQGPLHESISRTLYALILEFRRHGGPRFRATGTVTLSRADLDRGLECDESFYIASLDRAPDLSVNNLDLTNGPPPDLAVEV
ncbi:MAG: Uma2 family endonuclease, partial [Planctomycetota bacterium]